MKPTAPVRLVEQTQTGGIRLPDNVHPSAEAIRTCRLDTRAGCTACSLIYLARQRSIRLLALTDGAGLYRILTPVLDIVGNRDPRMPALLIDRDRRSRKA